MVKIIAHRGQRHNKKADENSLEVFGKVLFLADGIETDVSLSAEGTPFLIHDIAYVRVPRLYGKTVNTLRYKLNQASAKKVGRRRLDQLTDAEIESLRLKKGGKIPRLSELFALMARRPNKTLDIELKGPGSLRPVLVEIEKAVSAGHIRKEQIILSSFDYQAIVEAKKLAPDISCGLIFSGQSRGKTLIYPWAKGNETAYTHFSRKNLEDMVASGAKPDFAVLKATPRVARKMNLLHEYFPGMKVVLWDASSFSAQQKQSLKKVLSDASLRSRVEAVITNHPLKVRRILNKKPSSSRKP